MSRYTAGHLHHLANEAKNRFAELMRTLDTYGASGNSIVNVDGVRIRLAADDFKTILSEIRKLK